MRVVTFFAAGMLHEGSLVQHDGALRLLEEPAPTGAPRLDGIVTGLFTDHHVHLQLVDHALLAGSRLGRVVDLGADLGWIAGIARGTRMDSAGSGGYAASVSIRDDGARMDSAGSWAVRPAESIRPVAVDYAGPFLTAAGGYPSDRAWAPEGAVREIPDAASAGPVVDELAAAGASVIKIVANSDAGPVIDDETFAAIVRAARAHDLPAVAHAEGAGQAQRAVRLGASRLAHAPFSERLTDDEIAEQAASASWISTLAVHDDAARAIAIDNVRRFCTAGGTVLYGSDMGNGDTPVDLRDSEIAALRDAGVDGIPLLRALDPLSPLTPGAALLVLPAGDPALARRLSPADLEV
ncbi:hydrolase [Microbacterium sp. NPDC058345]|uniref:hydrolase n=1 Tax=Microbacterium sp. NPDC058345 TaxID=3346455 RepID=UPI00365DADDC